MESLTSLRALVVDDSREFRALLSRALQKEHFLCDVAADGEAAEYLLDTHKYDVMLTDLRMPRKHGHQLVMEVMERPNPPIIVVMTGVMEPRLVADLIRRGVVDVIQKPLAFDVLAAKVKALVERQREMKTLPGGPVDGARLAEDLGKATTAMRSQLAEVTQSFELAIQNLEKQKTELEEEFHGSLRILSTLFDQVGASRGSHAGRVEKMALHIAGKVGMTSDQRHNLLFAALLHEVGQFGMPDNVRMKQPWSLNEEERLVFQAYPVIGAVLLSQVRGAERVAEIVEAHAENFDGTGFPRKLKGDQIPLGARIIRIADGCDSHLMVSEPANAIAALCEHLKAGKGHAYDPELAEFAVSYVKEAFLMPSAEDTREVPVASLHPGMVLAENVYDEAGLFLAREGAVLSENMLTRLRWLVRGKRIRVYRELDSEAH